MQNDNNLRPLVGKKKRGRKKNLWNQRMLGSDPNPNKFNPPGPAQVFQAPHQHQEAMMDLTDDTSPAVPVMPGPSLPLYVIAKGQNMGSNVTIKPNRTQKWQKFQASIKKKLDKKSEIKQRNLTWVNPNLNKDRQDEKMEPGTSGKTGEIQWELNAIDDDKPPENCNTQEPPTPIIQTAKVVHGLASEIKLTVQKQQAPLGNNPKNQPTPLFVEDPMHKNVFHQLKPLSVEDPVQKNAFHQPKPLFVEDSVQKNLLHQPKPLFVEDPVQKNVFHQPKPLFVEDSVQKNLLHQPKPAVQKNIFNIPQPSAQTASEKQYSGFGSHTRKPRYPKPAPILNYPKGVPKSFLMQQHFIGVNGAIQPQPGIGEPIVFEQQPAMRQAQFQAIQNPISSSWNPAPTMSPMDQAYAQVAPPPAVNINSKHDEPRQYSPSDAYDDGGKVEQASITESQGSDSPDDPSSQKRMSAFQRLGPLTQPKKPKLTINLLCNKDESVREVVDATEKDDKYTPVNLREDIASSTDDVVAKYFPFWPWKRNVIPRKTVTARTSKSVMILEQEQMEEVYDRDNTFVQVSVRGYPAAWRKEDVLDTVLDDLKGKSFIPCFIEFTAAECKFLIIRGRQALIWIHKIGFHIRKDDVELSVSISQVDIGLKQIDFIPRLVLRKLMGRDYDGERKLSLKQFTTKPDISHFIYFPLNRYTNQMEIIQLQSTVAWDYLTDLDLSHNRITSIDGFNLSANTPRLKHLDLSFNRLGKITFLLRCRELTLRSLKLEGNPLCHDYIDADHYVRVVKMMFPALTEIDGITIKLSGDMPEIIRNYCPTDESKLIAETFLERYYPFLDLAKEERTRIDNLYDEDAIMSVTYNLKLRLKPVFRYFRNLFMKARILEEGKTDPIEGAKAIAKYISKWPTTQHDPMTITVDVILHNDNATIIRTNGIMKLTSESLAEDEPLLAFARTVVLMTKNGVEYKIHNEMLYWDLPTKEYSNTAFQMNTLTTAKLLTLKLEPCSDEDLKQFKSKLLGIFIAITELDDKRSERCLEAKDWDLKAALEYFTKLVKLDDLDSLNI